MALLTEHPIRKMPLLSKPQPHLNIALNKNAEGNRIHNLSRQPLPFYKNHTYILLHRYPNSGTQSPLKADNEVYKGVPMGYGTIVSNGAAHGYKAQNPKITIYMTKMKLHRAEWPKN